MAGARISRLPPDSTLLPLGQGALLDPSRIKPGQTLKVKTAVEKKK